MPTGRANGAPDDRLREAIHGRITRPTEGRLVIVTDAGRDAVDVGSARDERGLLAYGQVVWF
jgi:hypothetical protein